RESENRDKEEQIIADDGADDCHLLLAGGKNPVFGKLVQTRNQQLSGDEHENYSGDAKEALQINPYTALHEHHAKDNCENHADQGSDEAEQLSGVELNGRKNQNRLNAFAQHHQEDEQEEAKAAAFFGESTNLGFDFALQLLGGTPHEPDHGDHKECRHQHDHALKHILIELRARERDRHPDARYECRYKSDIDRATKIGPADFIQVRQSNANDESGFSAFPESNDKGLQHEEIRS